MFQNTHWTETDSACSMGSTRDKELLRCWRWCPRSRVGCPGGKIHWTRSGEWGTGSEFHGSRRSSIIRRTYAGCLRALSAERSRRAVWSRFATQRRGLGCAGFWTQPGACNVQHISNLQYFAKPWDVLPPTTEPPTTEPPERPTTEPPERPTTDPESDLRTVTRLSRVDPTLNVARRSGLGDTATVPCRCRGLIPTPVAGLTRTGGATRGADIGDASGLSRDSPRGIVFDCARRAGLC